MNDYGTLNSATKYPSIDTYHVLDPANGNLTDAFSVFTGRVVLTEKINGANGRIIVMPDGDFFIGSREELLFAKGDRILSPSQGIVAALLPLAERISTSIAGQLRIYAYFLEVYGHRIGPAAKQYTGTGLTGYRLFDIATIPLNVLTWDREKISSWREHGGQDFLPESALDFVAETGNIPLVPRLGTVNAAELPYALSSMLAWMKEQLPKTSVRLDDSGLGAAEGIVLRSEDRKLIAKARFEDYERTLRKRAMQARGKR